MKTALLIAFTISIIILNIFLHSCNFNGIKFFALSNINKGYTPASGKVSNTFGTSRARYIDGDGDNDAAVILHNIAGSNGNFGTSIHLDQSGNIFVTDYSSNSSDYDLIVVKSEITPTYYSTPILTLKILLTISLLSQ
ncbi:MAG: hypothetical protein RMJ36_05425 [Candidatus Calescibacterium sp.]|nr:hypothetical protein [Candidatus Calescibacterium sp.]MDW8133076.1 hypothetical protein [Candidatus Calescibacterium sp.]